MESPEKVYEIIATELDVDKITILPTTAIASVADSLEKMNILIHIEEVFNLPVTPDIESQKMVTVQDIVSYVEKTA